LARGRKPSVSAEGLAQTQGEAAASAPALWPRDERSRQGWRGGRMPDRPDCLQLGPPPVENGPSHKTRTANLPRPRGRTRGDGAKKQFRGDHLSASKVET